MTHSLDCWKMPIAINELKIASIHHAQSLLPRAGGLRCYFAASMAKTGLEAAVDLQPGQSCLATVEKKLLERSIELDRFDYPTGQWWLASSDGMPGRVTVFMAPC